ncbi:MAG: peptide chain release factor-like protein [Candidatus Nealsonbacteria bacterium]|nr:peptide chain release factor-like protein [Candidatus Nealsonbacteria bacterium]
MDNFKELKKQTKVYFSTSTGSGGQRRDRKKTGVKLHHLSSGIIIHSDNRTSQSQNKKIAFQLLAEKLKKFSRPKKKRIPTRIPRYIKEKRLSQKKYHSLKKHLRQKPAPIISV